MTLRQKTLVLLGVVLILLTFQERAEGVRLCGKRLADLLNFICEKHGGFHAPRAKRDASSRTTNKRAVIEVLRPLTRRADSDLTKDDASGSSSDGDIGFSFHNGIVDECCKKQCTLATMVSYCANVQHVGNVDLDDIFPGSESLPGISEEDLAEYRMQQAPMAASLEANGAINHPMALANHMAYASRPNLGLSPRNRPVFIVLSQLQEDENRALGEYRF